MRSRHLTRNGGVPVFQIRVPKALDPALTQAPIRVSLGRVQNSRVRRVADVLAGLARIEFARIESGMDRIAPEVGRKRVEQCLTAALPTMLGLNALAGTPLSEVVREPATEAVFDALAEIGVARACRDGAVAPTSDPVAPQDHRSEDFAQAITALCGVYGLGLAGYPTLFILEPEDRAHRYTVDAEDRLRLT